MNSSFVALLSMLALFVGNSACAVESNDPIVTEKSRFSKIANNGSVLNASAVLGSGATDWACSRDNATGLIWEVKTGSGLRSQSHDYTWYSSKPATHGGSEGTPIGGTCAVSGRCDTEKFVADVNKLGLCGAKDWRLPSIDELISIVDASRFRPAIDPGYFPHTPVTGFWSASNGAHGSNYAWYLIASSGYADYYYKYSPLQVRLVRGGV